MNRPCWGTLFIQTQVDIAEQSLGISSTRKYEMRREMQETLPGLWLGPIQSAKNVESLKAHGITHIVCIRDAGEKHIVRPFFPNQFVYYEMYVGC